MMNDLISPYDMQWFRKPAMYTMDSEKLTIETEPQTSFHALAYDSTEAFGMIYPGKTSFVFSARMDYAFRGVKDECGLILKRDNTHWAKVSVENREDGLDLTCTVYADGYGDRSCREVSEGIRWIYFKILYWNGNVRFQYSFNGDKFSDMRWLHIADSDETPSPGIYACSPGSSWYDCTFSDIRMRDIF